jgi:hypothetical protein
MIDSILVSLAIMAGAAGLAGALRARRRMIHPPDNRTGA